MHNDAVFSDRPGAPHPLISLPSVTASFYARTWLTSDADRVWVTKALEAVHAQGFSIAAITAHMAVHLSLADSFALNAFTAWLDDFCVSVARAAQLHGRAIRRGTTSSAT